MRLLTIFLLAIFLSSCGSKIPASVAQKWIGQPEKKLQKLLKKGYIKEDNYYFTVQELTTPEEKSKAVRNNKTGETHYAPSLGKEKFQMTTKYFVEDGKVVRWEILYNSMDQ